MYNLEFEDRVFSGQLIADIRKSWDFFFPLSDEEFYHKLAKLKQRSFKKNQYILTKGEVCSEYFFLTKGATKYIQEKDTEEFIIDFNFEGEWCGDYYSFSTQKPSHLSIKAIEDVEVFALSHQDNCTLREQNINYEKLEFNMLRAAYFLALNRLIQFKSNSHEENYLQLLHHRPFIFKRVKIQDIATYLGITPSSLSRIRRKILKR
ncbi:Crp/Fnr family transcriptional regulator [Sphingobacterium spiritivorum]|uniref:Crp/Fnr family transcriptional regulator n=1 Tax=Sphingobacterium spiritivorum TaxID=258 RepID=UPI003DA628A7